MIEVADAIDTYMNGAWRSRAVSAKQVIASAIPTQRQVDTGERPSVRRDRMVRTTILEDLRRTTVTSHRKKAVLRARD